MALKHSVRVSVALLSVSLESNGRSLFRNVQLIPIFSSPDSPIEGKARGSAAGLPGDGVVIGARYWRGFTEAKLHESPSGRGRYKH